MGRTQTIFPDLPPDVKVALAELGDTVPVVWVSFEEVHPKQAAAIMVTPLVPREEQAKHNGCIWWLGFVSGWLRKGFKELE